MKILYIKSSPRQTRSKSNLIGDYIVNKLDGEILEQNLVDMNVPYLSNDVVAYNYGFMNYDKLSIEDKKIADLQESYIESVMNVDTLVLAVPMWNFSMPAILKSWFDMIIQVGKTFEVVDGQYKGLLTNIKKVYIAGATGGVSVGTDYDYLSSHLKTMLGFLGINDVEEFWVEKINSISPEEVEKQIAEVKKKIDDNI